MKVSREWIGLESAQKNIIERYQQSFPVKLGALAKEFGISVKKSTLPANISGEIKEVNGFVVIRVNRHDVKARQRYTLAHEIAHFLLHRHLLKDGIRDDVLYRSKQSSLVEAEANRLAADIIMPLTHTTSLIEKHSMDKEKDGLYEAAAEDLGVSTTALKIRLGLL